MAWGIYLVITARQIDGRAMDWAHQKFPGGRLIIQTFPVLEAKRLPSGKQTIELPHNVILSITIGVETVTLHLNDCRSGHRSGEEIMVSFGAAKDLRDTNNDLNVSLENLRRASIRQIIYEVPLFESARQPIKVNIVIASSIYQYALTWWNDDNGEFPATFIPEP